MIETEASPRERIRWGRVVGLAFALEVVLFATLLPLQPLLSLHVWFGAVVAGCAVFGYAAGWLVARGLTSRSALHGLWVGVIATAMYLLLNVFSGGIGAAVAFYGAPLFVSLNVLRIACCTLGAIMAPRAIRRETAAPR